MKEKGYILIVSLAFLFLMTTLAISMFGGLAMDETMSGNNREKSRSIDAAQTALNYAESWMAMPANTYTGNWVTGVNCGVPETPLTVPVVCSNALANPSSQSSVRSSGVSFTPANMSVSSAGGLSTYALAPAFYIQYLGSIDTYNALYQVTATSTGGSAAAAAVVQSVYQIHANSSNLGGG